MLQKIKFIISGGTAAAVDIAFLYVFTDIFKWWYIMSAILAFLIAFGVSFTLQKYWTFNAGGRSIHSELLWYLLVTSANLVFNTLLMYLFVDIAHIWYIFSQVIAGAIVAIESYFIYKHFIFKEKIKEDMPAGDMVV